jgi:hypothetical protein
MKSTTIARLRRLEKIGGGIAGPEAIIWQVINVADESNEFVRCENTKTGDMWNREAGESAEAFEQRMVDQARVLPGVPWLVMMPADQPEGEKERDG